VAIGWPFLLLFALVTVLVGEDCDGNGTDDAADIESGLHVDCDGNGIPDGYEFVPLEFAEGQSDLGLGGAPDFVVAIDTNGDEVLDLVAVSKGSPGTPSISTLVNRRDGTFAPATVSPAGESILSLTTADVDGDGDADVVTLHSGSVQVILNGGDGTLGLPGRSP
jgi:hypothetical protein